MLEHARPLDSESVALGRALGRTLAYDVSASEPVPGFDRHAQTTGVQGSHILTSMLGAEALALIPTDSEGVDAGEAVEIELIPSGCG